jgi:hypothetical protein
MKRAIVFVLASMTWRMRAAIGVLFVGLIAALTAGVALIGSAGLTIRIAQETAQAKLDARLPIESRSSLHDYKLTAAKIAFEGTGRIHLDGDFKIEFAGRVASGRCVGSAVPVYRNRAFYLEDLQVTHIEIGKLDLATHDLDRANHLARWLGGEGASPSKLDRSITDRAITGMIRGFLKETPVYEIDEKTTRHRLARMMLREIRVEHGVLVAVLDPTTPWSRLLDRMGL